MEKLSYRFAKEDDAERLLAIYAQYIPTTVTFEYVLPSEEEFSRRIREFTRSYPYIVCEKSDRVVGYAYAHRPFERAAAGWSAELTVYLDRDECGKGTGRELYKRLLLLLKMQNVHVAYGVVSSPNMPSERFHERMGFHRAAVFKEAGFKNGVWCDTVWYEMHISDMKKPPEQFLSVNELPEDDVKKILGE